MKKYLFIIAAASMVLAACSKEKELRAIDDETTEDRLPGWTYISALGGEEAATATLDKARIDNSDATFKWSTGDQIAIWSGETYYVSSPLSGSYNFTNNATFAFEGTIEAGRANFAVYPASLVYDGTAIRSGSISNHTASSLKITLPASYTLAQVQDNQAQTPMIAVNTKGAGLEFKSVCALLRINVKYVPKDAAFIKVSFPGKKVQGEFELQNFEAGTDGVLVAASSVDGDETITITDLGVSAFTDNITINIPVPIGKISDSDYPYVRVAAYDSFESYSHKINSIDVPIKTVGSAPVVWNPTRLTSRKIDAKLPYFTTNSKNGRKIVFAPGNLQADLVTLPTGGKVDNVTSSHPGAGENWRFAEHQYDVIGATNANLLKTGSEGGTIDLFSFFGASSTYAFENDNQKYGIELYYRTTELNGSVTNEALLRNWSELFNGVTYPANTWRLFSASLDDGESSKEVQRLFVARSSQAYISTKATILKENGDTLVRGLLVFPDNYVHPHGVGELVNHGRSDSPSGHYNQNVLTFAEWKILENVGGCAFLPAASARYGATPNLTAYAGSAAYWSGYATQADNAEVMECSDLNYGTRSFNGKTTLNPKSGLRCFGCSVRLIRNVN